MVDGGFNSRYASSVPPEGLHEEDAKRVFATNSIELGIKNPSRIAAGEHAPA